MIWCKRSGCMDKSGNFQDKKKQHKTKVLYAVLNVGTFFLWIELKCVVREREFLSIDGVTVACMHLIMFHEK